MQITCVDEITGPVGTGICEPLFAKIGEIDVVIKTYNNIETNKILANELICFKIAKLLDLPIPDAGLCIINENTTMLNGFVLDKECYGVGFYSTRVDKATRAVLTPYIVKKFISNKEDIIKIILFDHLICNKDRHKGNFLLTLGSEKKIYIIDHSHVFNIGSMWNHYQLQRFIDEKDYNTKDVLLWNQGGYEVFFESLNITMEDLLRHATEFQSKLNRNIFSSIIYDLPQEWGINNNDMEKLIEYLSYRLDNLEIMCNQIANFNY